MIFLDGDGRVLGANRGAQLLLGARDELAAIFPDLTTDDRARALRDAVGNGVATIETTALHPDGSAFPAHAALSPLADGELVLVLRDASDLKRERERATHLLRQNVAVWAYALRATREVTPEGLAEAAVEHLATAVQAGYTEMLALAGDRLAVMHAFGWGSAPQPAGLVDPAAPTIYRDALTQRTLIARELHAADLEHAPHLQSLGMRYGSVVAIRAGDRVCLAGAFSRSPFAAEDKYPVQSIAAICEAVYGHRAAERQLARRDHTVSMILDQMPAILTTCDRELRFTSVQGAGLRALGSIDTNVIGQDVTTVIPPDGEAMRAFRAALRGESSTFSAVWRDRYYENRVEPLRNTTGEIVGMMNLGTDVTERVQNEKALAASREELRRLTRRLAESQEEERRRIAHELHDELGQRLTALRMEASLLPHKLGSRITPGDSEAIASMIELIADTIDTVRRVATELRPPILDDFGFRAAVELELSGLQKRSGIAYDIDFAPDDLQVGRDRATALYRIVQESLTNIARHSGATRVRVSVAEEPDSLVLRIVDNGRGITPEERTSSASVGLLGIRERAYSHGGEATIRTGENGGTIVEVRLPRPEREDRR